MTIVDPGIKGQIIVCMCIDEGAGGALFVIFPRIRPCKSNLSLLFQK